MPIKRLILVMLGVLAGTAMHGGCGGSPPAHPADENDRATIIIRSSNGSAGIQSFFNYARIEHGRFDSNGGATEFKHYHGSATDTRYFSILLDGWDGTPSCTDNSKHVLVANLKFSYATNKFFTVTLGDGRLLFDFFREKPRQLKNYKLFVPGEANFIAKITVTPLASGTTPFDCVRLDDEATIEIRQWRDNPATLGKN